MKFLIAFATLALFAVINANPYGQSRGGYGGGYGGEIAYVQEGSYGRGGGYGGHSQPLYSKNSGARAAAAAAANNGAVRPGRYDQVAVLGLEIDGGYNAPSYGNYGGRGGYGRGGY
ncbi:hypothetical protein KR215_005436 [Drosophila sulfurigaster]|nr:hypothetical protein KR215_005436 [Drosophila sulfurigaster]